MASLSAVAKAEAPAIALDLEWRANYAGCPSRSVVLERIRQLHATDSTTSQGIRGQAEVTRKNGRFVLVVRVQSGDVEDTRTAESESCSALGEAAAIILATAIDASRGRDASTPHPTGAGEETGAPPKSDEGTSARVATKADSGPLAHPSRAAVFGKVAVGIGVAPLLDIGTLPRPAVGLEFEAHVELDRWRLAVAGALWHPQERTFAEGSPGGATFDVQSVGGFACWTPLGVRLRLGGCAELDLSWLQISGFRIRHPSVARGTWPTLRAGVIAEAHVSRRAVVFVRTDATFALAIPRIVLTTTEDDVALHEVGAAGLRIAIGARANLF